MDKRERKLSILRRAEDLPIEMGERGLPDPHPLGIGNPGLAEDMIATAATLRLKKQESSSKTDPQSS